MLVGGKRKPRPMLGTPGASIAGRPVVWGEGGGRRARLALLAVPLTLVRMELSGRLCAVGVGKEGYLSLSSGCSEKRAPGVTAVLRSPADAAAAGPNISNLCSAVRVPGASAPYLLSPARRELRRR